MNVYDLIVDDKEEISLNDVFLDDQNLAQVKQLIKVHRYIEELSKYNLPVNNKILLHGFSGCGKTTTAKAIAKQIGVNKEIANATSTELSLTNDRE